MDIKPDEPRDIKINTTEDYERIQNLKLKFWLISKTFYLVFLFILVLITMGVYIFLYEKENRDLITQALNSFTQIVTTIIQAVIGT